WWTGVQRLCRGAVDRRPSNTTSAAALPTDRSFVAQLGQVLLRQVIGQPVGGIPVLRGRVAPDLIQPVHGGPGRPAQLAAGLGLVGAPAAGAPSDAAACRWGDR